jgi:hypothetical protein
VLLKVVVLEMATFKLMMMVNVVMYVIILLTYLEILLGDVKLVLHKL